jgi:hypothetical protein
MRVQSLPKDQFYSDENEADMHYYQPVMLMALDTLKKDLSIEELEVVKWVYNFLWMMYRSKPFISSIPITTDRFIRAECEALWLFDELEEMTDPGQRAELLVADLEIDQSRELMVVLYKQFQENPLFMMVNRNSDGAALAGVRALIQCFDNNMSRRWLW